MAIFYTAGAKEALAETIQAALATDPKSVASVSDAVKELVARASATKPALAWGKVAAAAAVLVVILAAGLYAGTVPALDAWNKALLHAFGVLLGLFVGLLGGERASAG